MVAMFMEGNPSCLKYLSGSVAPRKLVVVPSHKKRGLPIKYEEIKISHKSMTLKAVAPLGQKHFMVIVCVLYKHKRHKMSA